MIFLRYSFTTRRKIVPENSFERSLNLWRYSFRQKFETPILSIPPMKKDAQGNDMLKIESEYSQSDLESVSKNYRAMNQLCCALNGTEFNRVSSCTSAKEIWDKLVVTYEGTSQVLRSTSSCINTKCSR